MAVKHCDNHQKYTAGCPDCQVRSSEYQRELRDRPKLSNDRDRKFWGIRSKENWDRFNEMGKRLTACDM